MASDNSLGGEEGLRLSLSAVLDMPAAQALKDEFESGLATGKPLTIDAHKVERISTAAIQTLIAGVAALKSAGAGFTLSSPSEAFLEAFRDLGLDAVLMQWGIDT